MVPPSQGDRILAARLARSTSTPFRHHRFCSLSLSLALSLDIMYLLQYFSLIFKLKSKPRRIEVKSPINNTLKGFGFPVYSLQIFVGEALARNLWVLNSQAITITHAPTWQLDQLACSAAASQLVR